MAGTSTMEFGTVTSLFMMMVVRWAPIWREEVGSHWLENSILTWNRFVQKFGAIGNRRRLYESMFVWMFIRNESVAGVSISLPLIARQHFRHRSEYSRYAKAPCTERHMSGRWPKTFLEHAERVRITREWIAERGMCNERVRFDVIAWKCDAEITMKSTLAMSTMI